ncbi:cysteine proteinase [Serendipita vermifera]|nr:cysteine proteinase [Serendipita vermifera]
MSYRVGSKTDGSSGAQNSYSVQSKNVAPKPDAYAGKDGGSNADATIVKQDENTIGLLVTDQLDEAIQRCKERVEDIAQNCRARNQKFRDIEFDLDNGKDLCLFGLNTDNRTHYPADVMRVTDIFKEPTFFVDGPSFSDIAQGRDGDCYFLAALAMVATLPGLLEKICVARDQVVGVYGFIFFRDGLWQEVIIDDQLFVSVQPWGDLDETTKGLYQEDPYIYDSIARKGSKILYFAKSMNDNETWVPLIEKAYAKFYGNYTYISGGYTMEAVEDLTGGTSTLYMLNDFIDTSSLWEEFTRKDRREKLYACSFLQSSKWSGAHGLYTGHAYSILRAAEYNGKKFVIIRNPWGKGEWEGAWADGSKEWTNEWLPALEVLEHKFGNDGEFVMEFSDFLRQWQCLDCARLYDSSWVVSNIWVTLNGLNLNHPWTWGDVSFTIHVDAPTPAVIVLQQLDTRSFQEISGTVSYDFDFVVFKKGSKRVYASSAYNFFGTRSRNAELNLEAGDYVVHVRIDSSKNEGYLDESSETWDSRMLKRLMSKKTVAFSKALNATTE